MFVDMQQAPRTDTGNVKTKQTINVGELNTANIHEAKKKKDEEEKQESAWGNVFRKFSLANRASQAFSDGIKEEEGGNENEEDDEVGVGEDFSRASLTFSKQQEKEAKQNATRGREISLD
jgi:hypothetical protein